MRLWPFLLFLVLPAAAAEKAAYDSNGRLTALLSNAEDIEVRTHIVAVLPNGKRIPVQARRDGGGGGRGARPNRPRAWAILFVLPDGGRGQLDLKSDEDAAGLTYTVGLTAESDLEVSAIEFTLDLPRLDFVTGTATPDGAPPVGLASARAAGAVLYRGTIPALRVTNAAGDVNLDMAFDKPTAVSLVDRWDNLGRSFQVRAAIQGGVLAAGRTATLATTLRLRQVRPAPPSVKLTLDTGVPKFHFDGFGGNYCWSNLSPISKYTLENLKLGWARTEMKVIQWDKQRDQPGAELTADFETMRKFQQMRVPYVISIWWLPERFYTDPYEKPRSAHFRLIKPERWDELLDLLGGYLEYAKKEYGVEPDLFSFNEANIGIYVGLTPETHTEAIKRIRAHFGKLGLKTKMLLGDATGPKDTHKFVLEAAADPDALQYVGAIGFHSWGGGTPEQYTAWGDVAEWLKLPLLVTELGVDAAAYFTRSWDSYHYGLQEVKMTQELLTYARPQGTQFWQFTNDYALARTTPEGKVEPSSRFWLMKHFTDLTPQQSQGLSTTSDTRGVLYTAFRKDGRYALHILNLGAGCTASLEGLPAARWQIVETTEASQFQKRETVTSGGVAATVVELPAHSLVTLTGQTNEVGSIAPTDR